MRTIYILMVMALATSAIVAGVTGPSHAQAKADAPAVTGNNVVVAAKAP